MDAFFQNISRRKTKITVLATFELVREGLRRLLENDRNLHVIDVAGKPSDFIEKVLRRPPDVVLLCLTENEGGNVEVLSEFRRIAPDVKAVILSTPNSGLDQPAALKLGVTGIVGTNQNVRVLLRAIGQVSEGEVWLNQKLLAQLLNNDFSSATGGKKQKNKSFYRNDDLTSRELEVVAMIGLGLNNKDISKKMYISEATVRHHLSSIYSKLNVEDRLNLAIYAHQRQIVPSQSVVSL